MLLKKMMLGAILAGSIISCSSDDDSGSITNGEGLVETPSSISALEESNMLLESIRQDGGIPYNAASPALSFTDAQNVFLPSVLGLDFRIDRNVVPAGPTARFPMFQGWETLPEGGVREGYYVITESSSREMAEAMGIIYAPRMANAIGSDGVQQGTFTEDGRLVFEGSVDFSPKRSLVPGTPNGTLVGFPPANVVPGAKASDKWSSYVVLPSGTVINAQMVANSTGIHDRIPNPEGNTVEFQDALDNPNLSKAKASVVMQLLDGWQGGEKYYFHIVTDTSAEGPAAIELGVFAPRLAKLPTFGIFPGGSMLPFSPTANGIIDEDGNFQGLNTAVNSENQVMDPTNTFPIDPTDTTYAPMWDAHITEFKELDNRVILKSFEQINQLLEDGTLIPFRGNSAPTGQNSLSSLLSPTEAIINCPVIAQPRAAAIGQIIGEPTNE